MNRLTRRSMLAGLCGAGAVMAGGERRYQFAQTHMGAPVVVTLFAGSPGQAERAAIAAFQRIAQLDAILSDYRNDSEVLGLSRVAPGVDTAVSPDLFRVLEHSQTIAEESGGAFDPTAAPVIRLWRQARRRGRLPDPVKIRAALKAVGYRNFVLNPAARTVRLLRHGMRFDFGGIAKGFAAGEALSALRGQGTASALVAIAGDVAAADPPPGTDGWSVRLEPWPGGPQFDLMLAGRCASTSSAAEQFLDVNGIRYSHIIDPRTGQAVVQPFGASVVAAEGWAADAWSTVLNIEGPEGRLPESCRGVVISRQGDSFQSVSVNQFNLLLGDSHGSGRLSAQTAF